MPALTGKDWPALSPLFLLCYYIYFYYWSGFSIGSRGLSLNPMIFTRVWGKPLPHFIKIGKLAQTGGIQCSACTSRYFMSCTLQLCSLKALSRLTRFIAQSRNDLALWAQRAPWWTLTHIGYRLIFLSDGLVWAGPIPTAAQSALSGTPLFWNLSTISPVRVGAGLIRLPLPLAPYCKLCIIILRAVDRSTSTQRSCLTWLKSH